MKQFLTLVAAISTATPALAHHPLGGMPMETITHGLMSGVGHLVLGFGHMFFVIALGVAAVFTTQCYKTPLTYIVAMLVGCTLMYTGFAMPLTEIFIALSLLTMGAVVLSGRALQTSSAIILFVAFGLFHGSAFGDSIAAQESSMSISVLMGYLIGFGIVQYALALAAGWVIERLLTASESKALDAHLVGAMVAGVGAILCFEIMEGPIVALNAG